MYLGEDTRMTIFGFDFGFGFGFDSNFSFSLTIESRTQTKGLRTSNYTMMYKYRISERLIYL